MSLFYKLLVYLQIIYFATSQFLNSISRELQADIQNIQLPIVNSYYEIEINIGDEKVKYKVALDLTQSETWIEEYQCVKPEARTLQQIEKTDAEISSYKNVSQPQTIVHKSESCINQNKTATVESIYGTLSGQVINDNVSLGENIKANNMTLISVNKKESDPFFNSNPNLNGVLGLSYKQFSGSQFNFVEVLKQSGSIKSRIVAIGKNAFHIGDYPSEVKQLPKNYHSCNLTINEGLPEELMDGWICDLTHFLVGDSQSFSEAEEIEGRIIFDSMLKSIEAPKLFLGLIKAHYFDINYKENNCTVVELENKSYVVCEKQIARPLNLDFIIGGYALIIPGSKLFSVDQFSNKHIFNIIFAEQVHNVWRVGKLLLDEYMVVFDAENKQVGFYGENKINFEKEWKDWWSSDDSLTSQEHMKYLVIASISLGAALLFVIICLAYQGLKKKQVEDEAPLQEMENQY